MINDIEPPPLTVPVTNSHAVLSALKSLQDKIKRLEAERDAQARQFQELNCKLEVSKAETELAVQRERTTLFERERDTQHTVHMLTLERDRLLKEKEVAESTVLACSKDVSRLQQEVQRLHELQRRELREQDAVANKKLQETQKELQVCKARCTELEILHKSTREELEVIHTKKLVEHEELRRRSAEDIEHVRQATEQRVTARVLELEAQIERERQRSEAYLHQKHQVESTLNDLVKLHAALTQRVAALGHIPTKGQGDGRRRCRPSSSGPARTRSPTSSSLAKRSERHPSSGATCTHHSLIASSSGLHDALRKAGHLHTVPFVPVGTAGDSFHAVATAQRALDISFPREAEPAHSHHCHHNDDGIVIDDSRVELRRLCDQLEDEYAALQAKYLDILHQVQGKAGSTGTEALTSSMNALLTQMNAKGDQLRRLRLVDTSLGSSRVSPTRRYDGAGTSPRSSTIAASISRRTKTLQAFSDLREMQQAR